MDDSPGDDLEGRRVIYIGWQSRRSSLQWFVVRYVVDVILMDL